MKLIGFLESGKSLYIEGGDVLYHNRDGPLIEYLGCSFVNRGDRWSNVEYLYGNPETELKEFDYNYLTGELPDRYVDVIKPLDEAEILLYSQDEIARVVFYRDKIDDNGYRMITSSVIFGAFHNGNRPESELFSIYLDYLLVDTKTQEKD